MVRHREFEESEVLNQAMLVFWKYGYDGCSIRDLVNATGVQRQSLYNFFGDKEGLFLRVLKHYELQSEKALEMLRNEDASIADLRKYMQKVLEIQDEFEVSGCLMVKAAWLPEFDDLRIRKVIERSAKSVRRSIARLLDKAVAKGELPREIKTRTCADFLHTVLNGLSAYLRTGGTAEEAQAILSLALESVTKKAKDER